MSDTVPASRPGGTARFNESFARRATLVFGTMWAFYACTFYGLLPLGFPADTVTILYWSNFLQLIALPLLMVGTNILGRDSERRALETHDAVMEEVAGVRELVADLHAKHDTQQQQVGELHAFHVEGRLPEREVRPWLHDKP